jgi:hypothetical protein
MILPAVRDKRFITIRRGGVLTDEDHHLLAVWAAECAGHVLHYFEEARPDDDRPRRAIEAAHAWARGEIRMMQARDAAGASQDAAREVKESSEAARLAALSAGQAAVVAHVAAHELGAAAYAIRVVMAAAPKSERETSCAAAHDVSLDHCCAYAQQKARAQECQWQRNRLPKKIRELVLDDQRLRNDICWFVFENLEGGKENVL